MNKGRELRSFDSIGYYDNNSHKHKVNKAYQTWASLYLNYDDDNLDHFFTRDMDVYPLKEQGVDPNKWSDGELAYDAFVQSSIELAAEIVHHGTRIEHMLKHYPILKENEDKLRVEIAKLTA